MSIEVREDFSETGTGGFYTILSWLLAQSQQVLDGAGGAAWHLGVFQNKLSSQIFPAWQSAPTWYCHKISECSPVSKHRAILVLLCVLRAAAWLQWVNSADKCKIKVLLCKHDLHLYLTDGVQHAAALCEAKRAECCSVSWGFWLHLLYMTVSRYTRTTHCFSWFLVQPQSV